MRSKHDVALYPQTNIFPKQNVRKSYKCLLHRCAMNENLQLLVARQWNCDYWSAFLVVDTRWYSEIRCRLHPMNCVFDQLSRISFSFTRLIKLIRRGSYVTIPFYLEQFNMFSIFNNNICILKKFKFCAHSVITFPPIN